jgi:phage major head subunit gpT-like protein
VDITPANMQIFFTGLSATFGQAYQSTPVFWQRLAFLKPSNTEIEKDGWMAKIPVLREWLGPRVVQNAAARMYTLENKLWELTLGIDKFKVQDDTYGIYSPMLAMMGEQAAKWPDRMLVSKLRANSETLYDGKAYFADDHPVNVDDPLNSDVYDNNLGLALTPDNFASAYLSMATFKGEDGEPLGVTPNLLVVPPQLKLKALQILNGTMIAPATFAGQTQVGGNSNVLAGWCDLLVVPELAADATTWYLFDTSKAIKPFFFQQRQAPVLVPRIEPTDPSVFDTHTFLYGVEARGAIGYTLPFLGLRSIG